MGDGGGCVGKGDDWFGCLCGKGVEEFVWYIFIGLVGIVLWIVVQNVVVLDMDGDGLVIFGFGQFFVGMGYGVVDLWCKFQFFEDVVYLLGGCCRGFVYEVDQFGY